MSLSSVATKHHFQQQFSRSRSIFHQWSVLVLDTLLQFFNRFQPVIIEVFGIVCLFRCEVVPGLAVFASCSGRPPLSFNHERTCLVYSIEQKLSGGPSTLLAWLQARILATDESRFKFHCMRLLACWQFACNRGSHWKATYLLSISCGYLMSGEPATNRSTYSYASSLRPGHASWPRLQLVLTS